MTLTLSLAVISFCGSSFAASSNDTNVSGAGFEAIESSEKVKQGGRLCSRLHGQRRAVHQTIIEDAETLVAMLEDTAALDTKIAATQEEIDTVVEMNKALIREHAVTGLAQEIFDQKAVAYDERFRKAEAKLNRLKGEKQDRLMRVCSVKNYVENLRGQAGPIEVWNEQAWCLLVTQVTVHADDSAEFLFRGENRMTVK